MGQANLVNDEAWRAARQVVRHFHARLDDDELVEAFHAVRAILAAALTRALDRRDRERRRVGGDPPPGRPGET